MDRGERCFYLAHSLALLSAAFNNSSVGNYPVVLNSCKLVASSAFKSYIRSSTWMQWLLPSAGNISGRVLTTRG